MGTNHTGLGMYSRTRIPDAAAVLALFLYTEEGQKAFHGETCGAVPVLKSLSKSELWRNRESNWENKNMDALICYPEYDTVGNLGGRVPTDVASLIETPWSIMLRNHFDGHKHYLESLAEMEARVNEY